MKLIDWARKYRDELGFSVIPIPQGEKGPKIPWVQYQKRKPTDQELEGWFSGGERNIGVVCGGVSGNLAVLDFETPELYGEFFSKQQKLAKSTLVVRTGGGGYHVYLRTSEPVQSRKFRKPRLDLKAEGGQVVAPPSIHPNGTQYELISKELQVMKVPAGELNAFIKERIPREEPTGEMPRRAKEPYRGKDPACIEKVLEGVNEGYRNETAFRLACYWRNTRLLKSETVLNRLSKWNEGKNEPPLPPRELARVFNSADRGGYQFGCPGMQEFCTPGCSFKEVKRSEEAERIESELREREPTAVKEVEEVAERTIAAEEPINLPIDLHPLLGPIISFRSKNKNVFLGEYGLIGVSSSELEIKEENSSYSIPIRGVDWVSIERLTLTEILRLFLKARKTGELPKAPNSGEFFKTVYNKIVRYWGHSTEPRWRVVAALWIVGTYFHQVFDLYPIVILQGERESGKTTLLFVVKAFAWNPTSPSTALRPAPMFRKIDSSRPTFLIDITKLSDTERPDVVDVCEAGLEKGGKVARCVGEDNKVKEFGAYSPKMIATRSSLPFEAKAIRIVTCKPQDKQHFMELANRRDLELPEDPDKGEVKKMGILSFLKQWRKVRKAREEVKQTDDLYGRRFRLWRPLLTICRVFAPQHYDDVLGLAETDARMSAPTDYIYEVENAVISCTLDASSILLKDLTEMVGDHLGEQNVQWQTVKSAMENLGCIKKRLDTRAGKRYDLERAVIQRLAQARGILESEKKKEEGASLEELVEKIREVWKSVGGGTTERERFVDILQAKFETEPRKRLEEAVKKLEKYPKNPLYFKPEVEKLGE